MLDVRQIKAARALLEWNQDDLAAKSGMSKAAIANIERGSASPRQDTLDILQQTFEKFGLEFMEPAGVQLVGERFDLKIWDRREAQFKLWLDIVKELSHQEKPLLCISSVSDVPAYERYPKEIMTFIKRMDEIKAERRILLCEGDNKIIVNQPQWYRQMPKILFDQTPYYIYGSKIAFAFWEMQRIVRIDNVNMARGFRVQFDYNWGLGKPLDDFTVLS